MTGFSNVRDSRDDARRVFEASQSPGRWDRPVPPHGVDLKCPHCIAGHRYVGRLRFAGEWPDVRAEAECECGEVLVGPDPVKTWAAHVREVRA